jgi:UDP-GlcNAc:polypeptide alpha-N-acetylglucosaminyltransferase
MRGYCAASRLTRTWISFGKARSRSSPPGSAHSFRAKACIAVASLILVAVFAAAASGVDALAGASSSDWALPAGIMFHGGGGRAGDGASALVRSGDFSNGREYTPYLRGVTRTTPSWTESWTASDDRTVFIALATFRDPECSVSVNQIYTKAANPRRVFIGIIEQNEPSDPVCVPQTYYDCPVLLHNAKAEAARAEASRQALRPSRDDGRSSKKQHYIANYDGIPYENYFQADAANPYDVATGPFCPIDNIRRRRLVSSRGKGPCFGRYISMLMYRGEMVYVMIDAHNLFVRNWDRKSILQQQRARSSRPVLSHYPGGWDKNNETVETVSGMMVMCNCQYSDIGYIKAGATGFERTMEPRIQPISAGGYLSADAQLIRDVPFDPHLDYLFEGEEPLFSLRIFTAGWDLFTPGQNLLFHDYQRHKVIRFWDVQNQIPNNQDWHHKVGVSQQRAKAMMYVYRVNTTDQRLRGTMSAIHVFGRRWISTALARRAISWSTIAGLVWIWFTGRFCPRYLSATTTLKTRGRAGCNYQKRLLPGVEDAFLYPR